MIHRQDHRVQMIPIDQIQVVNSRSRGQFKFKQIIANIATLGLKKPITVARRETRDGDPRYDLACGQGRLEAFRARGAALVPAIVIDASKEDLLLMSLAENLARRRHTSVELAKEIAALKGRGYSFEDIARKTDLPVTYVRGIVRLLNKGEEQLLQAVEKGQIPLSIAITIASSDDESVQRALAEAYENKSLRGKALLKARHLIELRRHRGKALRGGQPRDNGNGHTVSSEKLMRTYHQEAARQRLLVRKAKICETRILFIVTALKSLLRDEGFVNLLRAEVLDTLPQFLAQQVEGRS